MAVQNHCEECEHYVYDEEWDGYLCEISMDMDDVARCGADSHWQCPYFRFYDEYRIVRKQN